MTDTTMKKKKRQTIIYLALHRQLQIE